MWKNYVEVQVENEKNESDKEIVERKIDYQEVVLSEVTEDLHFYTQSVDQRSMLENLLLQLRQELASNPPLPGAYKPTRGELAVAKFTGDDQWYRVKIEKISGTNVSVFYVDYGNRETVNVTRVADLPSRFANDKPYAYERVLACVALPNDVSILLRKVLYTSKLYGICNDFLFINIHRMMTKRQQLKSLKKM